MPSYRPFVIRIGQPEDGFHPLTAEFQGLQADADIPAAVLRQCLADYTRASTVDADPAYAHVGRRLFAALFTGDVLRLFETARGWLAPGEQLRIVLAQPLPDPLDDLPWELVFDAPGEPKTLAASANVPLVRHAPTATLPHQPPRKGALRVLAVAAFPDGVLPPGVAVQALTQGLPLRETLRLLSRQLDLAGLKEGARRVTQGRRYQVTLLQDASAQNVQEAIASAAARGEPYHVIHFFGQADGEGRLLLLGEDGVWRGHTAAEFTALTVAESITVLVVTLCQPERARETIRCAADAAIQRGVPAVVGMHIPQLDTRAIDFAREFYRSLAAGEPIELALAYARKLVRQLHGESGGPHLPAVYMAHTGGLRLPALERVHVVPRAWRFVSWALATAFAVVGTTSGILDLPSFPYMLRQRAPVIRCLWPNPLDSNRLTIAFMPLTVVTENGTPTHGADGHAVADFLYQRFSPALDKLDLSVPYEVRSPDLACQLPGRTGEARAASARGYAGKIGADILIYGVITDTAKADRMALAFNVDYRGYEHADEVTGPFALGGSLPVTLPFDSQELLVIEHPPHLVRMNVLAELVVGLSYLRADNPEKALTYFERAADDPYWPSVDGKEFAYLLVGQARTRQASVTGSAGTLSAALEAYETALKLKPGYVRAELGKGSTLALLSVAQRGADGSRVLDRAKLGEAEAAYRAVLERATALTPLEAATAHAGLGYVYLTSVLYGRPEDAGPARAELTQVVAAYAAGRHEIARAAGQAYGYLGLLAVQEGDVAAAKENYSRALDLVTPVSRAMYLARLGQLACGEGRRADALATMSRAVDEARLYGRATEVEEYSRRLSALQAASCP